MFTAFNFQISRRSLPWDFGCKTCLEIALQKAFYISVSLEIAIQVGALRSINI